MTAASAAFALCCIPLLWVCVSSAEIGGKGPICTAPHGAAHTAAQTPPGVRTSSLLQRSEPTLRKSSVAAEEKQSQPLQPTQRKPATGPTPVPWGDFKSRDQIPSGCVLPEKDRLPDGSRCIFSDQCVANKCCPYLKVCNPPITNAMVKADPLLKSIMWQAAYGGASTCGEQFCDTCPFRGSKTTPYQCNEVNGEPIMEGSPYAGMLPLWNTEDPACNCDSRFQSAMEDGSWVPKCPPVGTAASSALPAPSLPAPSPPAPTPAAPVPPQPSLPAPSPPAPSPPPTSGSDAPGACEDFCADEIAELKSYGEFKGPTDEICDAREAVCNGCAECKPGAAATDEPSDGKAGKGRAGKGRARK